MDRGKFLALQSEIAAQLALVDDVFERIEDRALNFDVDRACERQLESVTFQIHCAYNAFKSILRLIAARFEYRISDEARWHSPFLVRMTHPIPGVRPAPLTKEACRLLGLLQVFRHGFLHANTFGVDPALVQSNLHRARQAHDLFHRDIADFLDQIRPAM